MATPRVPERHRLEMSFVRARWLGVAALAVLAAMAGSAGWPLWPAVVLLSLGNLLVARRSARLCAFADQRRLAVSAVVLDATVVWLVVLGAQAELTPSIYTLFILVAAEASIRFAPLKGFAASGALGAGLGLAMALRALAGTQPFDLRLFLFWAILIALIGTVVGTAVREVYRQRAGLPALPSDLDPEMAASLTRRERQVLTMIIQGHSNGRIAEALFIERKTVKNHINSIYSKLHLSSRYQAIAMAISQRQLEEEALVQKEEPRAQDRVRPLP